MSPLMYPVWLKLLIYRALFKTSLLPKPPVRRKPSGSVPVVPGRPHDPIRFKAGHCTYANAWLAPPFP